MKESPSLAFRRVARKLLRESLLLSLLVTFFAIVSVPQWEGRSYAVSPAEVVVYDIPPELRLPERPREAMARPEIPVEADEDEDIPPEETIARTILREDDYVRSDPFVGLPTMGAFVARDTEPQFIRFVNPEYPELAIRAGVEGVVLVNLLVDTEGRIVKAVAVSGPPILRDAAVAAALQCLLTPALQRDKPVAVWIALPFRFTLRDTQ